VTHNPSPLLTILPRYVPTILHRYVPSFATCHPCSCITTPRCHSRCLRCFSLSFATIAAFHCPSLLLAILLAALRCCSPSFASARYSSLVFAIFRCCSLSFTVSLYLSLLSVILCRFSLFFGSTHNSVSLLASLRIYSQSLATTHYYSPRLASLPHYLPSFAACHPCCCSQRIANARCRLLPSLLLAVLRCLRCFSLSFAILRHCPLSIAAACYYSLLLAILRRYLLSFAPFRYPSPL